MRDSRRADLARYFGAQLAPSAALQAADATLLQALEVRPTCPSAKPIPVDTNDVPWHQDKPGAACHCTATLVSVIDLQLLPRAENVVQGLTHTHQVPLQKGQPCHHWAPMLQAMDTWARSDEAAVPLLLVQVEPSANSDDDAFVMQSGSDAVRFRCLLLQSVWLCSISAVASN